MGRLMNTLLLILFVIAMSTAEAGAANFKNISAQELKAKLDRGEKMLLLNPLSDIEFNENHIPGSVNIPLHMISTTDKLPADKSTPIITYCLGPK